MAARWAVVLAALVSAPAAQAGEDDAARAPPRAEVVSSEVVIVTGLRLPRPPSDVPAVVTVVSRAEIERNPRSTADDVLRSVPSVATFRRSSSLVADPTSQGLNLRGLGPSGVARALVLRDGVPLNDPYGGWIAWRSIPLLDLERVEIQPSGASALFGNFALGGVVQTFSRPIVDRRVDALVTAGSLETRRAAVRVTERRGALAAAVDGDFLNSAGFAPIAPDQRGLVDGRAASTHGNLGARAEWQAGRSRLRAHTRLFGESLDTGTRYTTVDLRLFTAGLGWSRRQAWGTVDAQLFVGDQLLRQVRARVNQDRSDASIASRQRVPASSQGAGASFTSPALRGAGEHVLLAGVDALRVAGTSEETLYPAMPEPDSLVWKSSGGEQRFLGLFAQDAARLSGNLRASAAVRLDVWQNRAGQRTLVQADGDSMTIPYPARTDVQVDPRVGLLQRIGPVGLRVSGYRAFRAPTLNELYRSFQVGTVLTESNPDLRAETLWGAEAGPELTTGSVTTRITGFWNRIDDPINTVTLAEPLPGGATRQRQNLGRARVRGLELEASWRPSARWIALLGYTFVDARVTSAPEQPELVGLRLAQDPRHRGTAALTFDDPGIATVTAQWRWIGGQFEDDRNTLPMEPYLVVDALAARAVGRGVAIFLAIENLTGERYLVGRAGVDTIGPPRTVQAGVRLTTAAD